MLDATRNIIYGKDKRIAKILKKWSTPCLISNGKHVLMLSPNENGWHQETVMEFDGVETTTVCDRLAGLAMSKIDEYVKKTPENKKLVMPYLTRYHVRSKQIWCKNRP